MGFNSALKGLSGGTDIWKRAARTSIIKSKLLSKIKKWE
jgi:hypothetical protein